MNGIDSGVDVNIVSGKNMNGVNSKEAALNPVPSRPARNFGHSYRVLP